MRRLAAAILLILPASIAGANGPQLPDTVDVDLVPGGAPQVGLETSFGYLDAADGGTFTWICHDTVMRPGLTAVPTFERSRAGAFLVGIPALGMGQDPAATLYRSADGCDWAPVAAFSGQVVRGIAWDPSDPLRAIATTGNSSGANAVWLTTDGGLSWSARLSATSRLFRRVVFSDAHPADVWTTANWSAPAAAWLYRSQDGGRTWSEIPWTFPTGSGVTTNVDVLAVSPTSGGTAWLRAFTGVGYLVLTTDGGASFDVRSSDPQNIAAAHYAPDASLWVATASTAGLFHETDGRDVVLVRPSPPHFRGFQVDARGIWAAASLYDDGYALGLSSDGGASFAPRFRFVDLTGPRSCPAGSTGASVCDPLWPALEQTLGIPTPTPTPSASPTPGNGGGGGGGCGCEVRGGGIPAIFLGALLLLVASRIRRRARHEMDEG